MNPKRKFCTNDRGKKNRAVGKDQKIIMHLDMDAFFAAIEQAHQPHLRGKPVIIGGNPEWRGVVSTCSYEARKYGVHSAMSSAKAVRLCPSGIFVETSSSKVNNVSLEIMKMLCEFSPQVEPFSVDEAFLDITETAQRRGGPKKLALEIKRRIWESHRLTASIGIAAIRFVAKMASSTSKPDGLTIIAPGKEREFLWTQPIRNLWGVGPKSEEAFHKIGIFTIADLARYPAQRLKRYLGVVGEALKEMANGIGETEIRASYVEPEEKSMGHEHTFKRDVIDPHRISGMLLYLSDRVSRRLRRAGYKGRTITLKTRHSNFKLKTRAKTIWAPTDCSQTIYQTAMRLLEENRFIESPIRLIGVSVSKLVKFSQGNNDSACIQQSLIDGGEARLTAVDVLMDSLRDRFGEQIINRATQNIL